MIEEVDEMTLAGLLNSLIDITLIIILTMRQANIYIYYYLYYYQLHNHNKGTIMDLVINNTAIKKDDSGRYSLNDLHQASGGNHNHQPNYFIRTKSFKETVKFLTPTILGINPIERKAGRYGGGTWICEQLVIEYAMWVNVEFKVKVMQHFLDSHQKKEAPATMAALNELTKKIESDKAIASKCGQALANYKKVKKENTQNWQESVSTVQFKLDIK